MIKKPVKMDIHAVILLIATIAWMSVIFYFSAQPAVDSARISSNLSDVLLDLCKKVYKQNPPDIITEVILKGDHYIRKSGHAVEYLILGLLVTALMKRLGLKRYFIVSAMVCLIYAASDEFHQMFVPGRGPMLSDVLLDFIAAAIGNFIISIKRKNKQSLIPNL